MVLATRTEWRNVLPTVSRLFRRRDSFSVSRTNWSIKGKWDSRAGGRAVATVPGQRATVTRDLE
jgi:hypothetical protein